MRMKRMNACSYALTWVDVGFNMKVSAAVFFSKYSFQRISQTRRNALRTHFLIGSLRISLVGYVCINPLHDENETHERMLLRTDMGRCRVQHENLRDCFLNDMSPRDSLFTVLTSHGCWTFPVTHYKMIIMFSDFVSLVDDVCSNPLHDERERSRTHVLIWRQPRPWWWSWP